MIIKKSTYNRCGECNHTTDVVPTVYGCDKCGKTLTNEGGKLELQLFGTDLDDDRDGYVFEGGKTYDYCNWYCLMQHLPSREGYNFIQFPALYPDVVPEFLEACRMERINLNV